MAFSCQISVPLSQVHLYLLLPSPLLRCTLSASTLSNLQVAVYQPPGPGTAFFNHFATQLLHFLSTDIPNISIDMHHSAATKLLLLPSSFGLPKWSSAATHIEGYTLDLVCTRLCSLASFSNSPLPISDHNLPTFFLFSL